MKTITFLILFFTCLNIQGQVKSDSIPSIDLKLFKANGIRYLDQRAISRTVYIAGTALMAFTPILIRSSHPELRYAFWGIGGAMVIGGTIKFHFADKHLRKAFNNLIQ